MGVNSHDAAEDIVQWQRPKAAAVDSSGRRQLLVVRQHPAVAVGYLEVEPLKNVKTLLVTCVWVCVEWRSDLLLLGIALLPALMGNDTLPTNVLQK